ncbi:MAG: hypothetical protein ABI867_26565 [Kofleriaceae bacterium]
MSWAVGRIDEVAFEQLASGLAGTELQSLLLEVMRRRAAARTPAEVMAQYRRDRFVYPAPIDQRTLHAIDGHLLAAADRFEAIELSPIAPLATSSCVALTDQHRVVSALRGTEVVSDPTNVLALECATRMPGPTHLATSQRVVRAQPVPDVPGFTQHFRIFVLASAGVEAKAHAFTIATLVLHIQTLLAALDRCEQHGYAFGSRRLVVLATPPRAALADAVAAAITGLPVTREPLDHAYYSGGIRYMLWATTPDGREVPLGDGGSFDWLGKLAANRRAVFVASGLGAQLIALAFSTDPADPLRT